MTVQTVSADALTGVDIGSVVVSYPTPLPWLLTICLVAGCLLPHAYTTLFPPTFPTTVVGRYLLALGMHRYTSLFIVDVLLFSRLVNITTGQVLQHTFLQLIRVLPRLTLPRQHLFSAWPLRILQTALAHLPHSCCATLYNTVGSRIAYRSA